MSYKSDGVMKKNNLIFLPLLFIYLIIIYVFNPVLEGDEFRYLSYAKNLANGFFTDPLNPDLSNGPAYPLVLLPFVALNIDILIPRLLNGILVYIGVLYFYKTLLLYTTKRYALIFALIIGLYPPMIRWMILLYSEALAFMLISGLIFHFCYLCQNNRQNWKSYILPSFYLGSLVLTKVIFFQVMIISAIILAILFLSKNKKFVQRSIVVIAGATIFISPFIIYAYSVTGKLFYLGTRGGEILYHRSSPFENEWGNWYSFDDVLGNSPEGDQADEANQNLSRLSANHRDFYLQVLPLSNIERDDAFKAKAIANMKEYPQKYLKNTVSNVGRLLFNYPISYKSQDLSAFGYMIPNMFIMVLFIMIIYPAFLSRKRIPFEVKAHLIFILIYGAGMIALGGKARYFIIMVPSLVLFVAYVYTNILKNAMTVIQRK